MLKYLLFITLLRSIICTFPNVKIKEFSRHDAEYFIELLENEKMRVPKMIEQNGVNVLKKFSKEFKIILANLNKKINKGEKVKKIMHTGEMRELNDEEKEQLGVAYWHLFGSNLLEKLLEYSFLNDEVFHTYHLLKFLGPKSIESRREEMGKLWEKFYEKIRNILQANYKLKLDEKFVRDLSEKGKFALAMSEGTFGKKILEENYKDKMENGLEEAEMNIKEAAKKFPFTKSQQLLDHFCTIIKQVDLGDDAELRKKVEMQLGTFKCPEDNLALIKLLRGTIFVLDENERENLLDFLTSHYFRTKLSQIQIYCHDFSDLLAQGRWHIPLFWGLQKQMGQGSEKYLDIMNKASFRFLMSNFFNPLFKFLRKFGDKCILEDRCILEKNLFGLFLLEFTIELAKREGDPGEIHFQGRNIFVVSEHTADILENPPPKFEKIVNELRKYSVDMVGQMPKKVADLMGAKFNSAGVEMGHIERKLIKFVEKEKKKKMQLLNT